MLGQFDRDRLHQAHQVELGCGVGGNLGEAPLAGVRRDGHPPATVPRRGEGLHVDDGRADDQRVQAHEGSYRPLDRCGCVLRGAHIRLECQHGLTQLSLGALISRKHGDRAIVRQTLRIDA